MGTITVKSSTAIRIIGFCILTVLCSTSFAMDETASPGSSPVAAQNPHYSQLIDTRDQLGGGKRAYTYRSEYKRLPLYQFGLGKRWAQGFDDKRAQRFSFGLGKRTRPYPYDLDKRSSYDDGEGARISYGYLPNELYETYAQKDALENYLQGKRTGRFNFGLGKRDVEMNGEMMRDDGLHEKLPVKHSRDKYLFGLGKRFYEDEDEESSAQIA